MHCVVQDGSDLCYVPLTVGLLFGAQGANADDGRATVDNAPRSCRMSSFGETVRRSRIHGDASHDPQRVVVQRASAHEPSSARAHASAAVARRAQVSVDDLREEPVGPVRVRAAVARVDLRHPAPDAPPLSSTGT